MNITPRGQLWIILIIVFLGYLGLSMPYLIFPVLFLNPEYSILPVAASPTTHAILLGVTLAAYPLGQFLGCPILGALSDDHGRKPVLATSLALAALCYLMTGFALASHHLTLVILCRFVTGLMEGNIAIARAMAADIKSLSKHETFGKINAAGSISFLVGPLVGGLLADKNFFKGATLSTPFNLIGILFLGLALLSLFILKSQPSSQKPKSLLSHFNLAKRLSHLFKHKQLRFLLIVSTFLTLAIDIFYEFGPVYLTEKWMLGPAELTIYNTILCLTLVIGNGWLPTYSVKKYTTRKLIISSMAALSLLLVATVLTGKPMLMFTIFGIIGLAIGLGTTLITVKISDAASDNVQGEVMGVQMSLRVLGDAVICLLGGVLLLFSSKLILLLAAAISLVTMLYFSSKRNY